jgi:hypothetical protein
MARSRKKQPSASTGTPLFYEAMAEINRDHPLTEAEVQATVVRK